MGVNWIFAFIGIPVFRELKREGSANLPQPALL